MSILESLSEEECYLYAIISDRSGLDLAEFSMVNLEEDDACFRAWPFQWKWWRDDSPRQIDCASRSVGKALDVETPIPTPEGWVRIGDIEAGDVVYDENGNIVNVTDAFDFLHDRECYEVVFDDGSVIIADSEHQWVTELCKEKDSKSIRTTSEIRDTLKKYGESNHRIPVCSRLAGKWVDLAVTPYFLGFWLGDGDTSQAALTIGDQDLEEMTLILNDEGYSLNKMQGGQWHYKVTQTGVETEWEYLEVFDDDDYRPQGRSLTSKEVRLIREKAHSGFSLLGLAEEFSTTPASITQFVRGQYRRNAGGYVRKDVAGNEINSALREIGVIGNKHIPSQLLRGTVEQRLSLLQGLMDSDGHCTKSGSRCEITLKDKNLASQVKELVMSLGQRAFWSEKRAYCNGVDAGLVYRVGFTPLDIQPFRLSRKMDRVNKTLSANSRKRLSYRRVVDVRKVDSRPVRCISVDGESHLYLAGISMIPTHNSLSIKLRAYAFPFNYPNQEMVITAPEGVHLDAITDVVETAFMNNRLARYMLAAGRSRVKHRPFHVGFNNGSRIMGRIPQHDGKAIKGTHPVVLEQDEASDYPTQGWMEIIETLKMGSENSVWRAHGVTRGVRDHFYKFTQPDSGWKVHRIVAMARPTWSDEERQAKIELYGSRDHPDYRRNVLGDHGDSENVLFVLSRLMATVDQTEDSDYNSKLYTSIKITPEKIAEVGGVLNLLDIPRTHMEYEKFWIGMDVGYINDPSEIVVFGEETVGKKRTLRLLARFSLERVAHQDQVEAILWVLETYKPQAFSCDKMQPVSEPVLTPSGWIPIGDLSVGDSVIGSDGSPTKVMGVYPQTDRRVMKVTFSDGSWTRCGPEHLWTVSRTVSRKKKSHTLTTEQLKGFMDAGIGPWNIPILSSPVEYDVAPELPIDPYLLGFLIGDGNLRKRSVRFSTADEEIVSRLKDIIPDDLEIRYQSKYDYHISTKEHRQKRREDGTWCHKNSLLESLRDLGLAGKYSHEKFIPEIYKYASVEDRISIIRGIMDSDGYCLNEGRSFGIRSSSEQLIQDVIEIVESLGGSGNYNSHRTFCNGKEHRTAYRATLAFPADINPFNLARKRDAVKPRLRGYGRFVRSIEPMEDEDSVCIRVEAEDSLYTTRHCILTHNTGLGLPLYQAILHETQKHPVLKRQTDKINGYGFSEKILAEIDTSIEVDPHMGDLVKEAGIHRNVLEWSTDILRGMVDKGTIVLPYDLSVIQQFQGQTYHYSKASQDMYGRRRIFSQGTFHVLDACRMAVLGWQQADLAPMLVQEKKQIARPMFMFG